METPIMGLFLKLVSGESKHRAVADWRAGKDIRARAIMPAAGVDVLVESRCSHF
jgi:hypothetical protein